MTGGGSGEHDVITATTATSPAMAMLQRFDVGPAFPADLNACSSDGRRRLPVPRGHPADQGYRLRGLHPNRCRSGQYALPGNTLMSADIRPIRTAGLCAFSLISRITA
jgi:hypothetical protein